MPKRPATSGYARLAQAEDDDRDYYDESEDEAGPRRISSPMQYAPLNARDQMHLPGPSTPPEYRRRSNGYARRRKRSNSSGVDIKAINARLERWAEEIASRFKISRGPGKTAHDEKLEIHHTVFRAPNGVLPYTADQLDTDEFEAEQKRNRAEFETIVDSVRTAIELGVHPKMITQGSSGSYFARNAEGKVVGVFKPKDEEPYASRNPKWTKWLHRNLFPCCFGRACLIPNLSYVSEAAASVLDARLRTNIVPYTDVVWLSSKSFHYDFWERRKAWSGRKPLPPKPGSFQVFLKGYKDATLFLREHPWPDQNNSGFNTDDAPKRKKRPWNEACRPSGIHSEDEDEDYDEHRARTPSPQSVDSENRFHWSENLKQSFREELEKLVILDYIMRNTDRGLDNWMIRVDWQTEEVSIVAEPPKPNGTAQDDESDPALPARTVPLNPERQNTNQTARLPYRRHEAMVATSRSGTPSHASEKHATIKLGAIDNSLSWPWKHPDAWRSFPFGWLFLPVSLIGQPFSQKTRDHFIPLLTSTAWWSGTHAALRRVFVEDADFKESMFARQMAVMKGQAWNVVETLKQPDHGPLELTRRTRVCVWDDLVDIPVAIPMRGPSTEVQRQRMRASMRDQDDDQEMDISAAISGSPEQDHDLLGLGSPPSELPNPNRFELARGRGSVELGSIGEGPDDIGFDRYHGADDGGGLAKSWAAQPSRSRDYKESSHNGRLERSARHARHGSLSQRQGSNSWSFAGDDLEGDLGYAAAEEMEGHERKVIVERLEAVKSKNPIFTWC